MKKWSDAKRYLFEDIFVYSITLFFCLGFDWILWFLSLIGLTVLFNQEVVHPHAFGAYQILGGLISAIQLGRKCLDWRYLG